MHLSFTDDAGRRQESSRKDPKYLYASDATPHAKSKFTNLIAVSSLSILPRLKKIECTRVIPF